MIIGILGAGQLGRMLALAGYSLGFRFRFFDSAADAPAGQLAPLQVGSFEDFAALDRFADGCDVITYEFENVPFAAARHLARRVPVYPPPEALEASQDRIAEKSLFTSLGIPTPAFARVDSAADLEAAIHRVGLPAVLKTRRLGYDGKGQAVIRSASEAAEAIARLGGGNLIIESLVPFKRELSAIATRALDGATVIYPIGENTHEGGILRTTFAPAPGASSAALVQARRSIQSILQSLNYVGTLAVEFFDAEDGLLANEMAPRVHNTGHWTIEGCRTSQFENHIRAITGLPLGDTSPIGHCGMVNIVGHEPNAASILATGAHLHLYGKEPRSGRKLGHATLVNTSLEDLTRGMKSLDGLVRERFAEKSG